MQGKTVLKDLEKYFQKAKSNKIEFKGLCHDCNREVSIKADVNKEGKITVSGGAIYFEDENDEDGDFFVKCEKCFDKDKVLRNYREIDTFSRVVGFLTPVKTHWNKGKLAEWEMRKEYKLPTEEQLKSLNFE